MRGIKRINGERVTQKLPITPDVLHKMQCHLHLDSSFDATFWAACLVAFFSFFRKSNLLPPSTTEFDTKRHLRKCDVRLFPWGIILVVRWSKTIQYRDRTLLVPVPKIAHSSLCPWSAVTRAFKVAGVYQSNKSASESAFTYLEDGVLKTLTYTTFTTKLKRILDDTAATIARVSLDTPSGKGVLHLPCIVACLAIILSYKATGNRLHMSVT